MLIDWDNLPDGYDDRSMRFHSEKLNILPGKRPKHMPQAIWTGIDRSRTICATATAAGLLYILIGGIVRIGFINTPFLHRLFDATLDFALMFSCIAGLLLMVIPQTAIRRYLRRVDKHNGELCLTCGYHLHGLPAEHRCPECGTEYSLDETRETWRKIILSNVKPPRRKERTT